MVLGSRFRRRGQPRCLDVLAVQSQAASRVSTGERRDSAGNSTTATFALLEAQTIQWGGTTGGSDAVVSRSNVE